jgi:hypothetical protein
MCLFADDLRFEVGNKLSLMGLYNGALILPSEPPFFLPKLYFAVYVITDIEDIFTELTTIVNFPPTDTELTRVTAKLAETTIVNRDGAEQVAFQQFFHIASVTLPSAGYIEVTVKTERETLRAGRLLIRSWTLDGAAQTPPIPSPSASPPPS